ncbi:hypothetical protein ACFLY6_02690 [Candidatus Dependentiae bacterium]
MKRSGLLLMFFGLSCGVFGAFGGESGLPVRIAKKALLAPNMWFTYMISAVLVSEFASKFGETKRELCKKAEKGGSEKPLKMQVIKNTFKNIWKRNSLFVSTCVALLIASGVIQFIGSENSYEESNGFLDGFMSIATRPVTETCGGSCEGQRRTGGSGLVVGAFSSSPQSFPSSSSSSLSHSMASLVSSPAGAS